MALMGSWNGFDFEVSPTAVRSFTGLTIKGGSETEDKVSSKQKYVKRTNSAITEIALNVYLNAYMGCSVRDEALKFISTAMEGATNYFYVGGKKLVTYKLMLTNAEITETEIGPDGTWIACKIALTMKQCEKYDASSDTSSSGSGSSGSGKQPAKQTVKTENILTKTVNAVKDVVTGAIEGTKNLVNKVVDKVKGSKSAASTTSSATKKAENFISNAVNSVKNIVNAAKKATTTTKKSVSAAGGGGGKSQIMMTRK